MEFKRFFKKLMLFLAIPSVILIFTFFAFNYISNKMLDDYLSDKTAVSLFIGDSKIQASINDKEVRNSINLGQDAESYIFSYYKLAGLLKNKSSVKKVYLGYSYSSTSSFYEDYITGANGVFVTRRYFFILPPSEKLNFIKYNSKKLPSFFKIIMIAGIKNILLKDGEYSFLGFYKNDFNATCAAKNSMDMRIAFQFYNKDSLCHFSNFNITYLLKIIDLCKQYNIELVMLNPPLHPYYLKKIPHEYITEYNDLIDTYKMKVVDFNDLQLTDSCFMPDGDHVSQKGVKLVSEYLNRTNAGTSKP